MKIKELTIQAFTEYTKNSPLKNYMQSEEYARFMGEHKFNYDYIGLVDDADCIVGASLILWKKIGLRDKYGYAPKGFLINYYDENLFRTFTDLLKEYYEKKNFVFIKIDPEIVVSEIDNKTYEANANPNMRLKQDIQRFGYLKLKDNLYFESMNPRFNAYIELKNSSFENFSKAHRNKIRNASRKGLYIEEGKEEDLELFYSTLDDKSKPLSYYKTLFNMFKDKIELVLVRVNYEDQIKNAQKLYDEEQDRNNLFNEILHRSHKEEDLNKKMASDSRLCTIKNEMILATEGLRSSNNKVVAAALIIKWDNRVHIVSSGYDKETLYLNANYFLFNSLIERYKEEYDFLDLNGITGDFKDTNPYYGLNKFKLGFNPKIYEFIGEYDLIINRSSYDFLLLTGRLAGEFNKNRE